MLSPMIGKTPVAMMDQTATPRMERTAAEKGIFNWIHKPFKHPITLQEIEAVFAEEKQPRSPRMDSGCVETF